MSKITVRNLIISLVLLLVSIGVFGYGVFFIERQNAQLLDQITALEKDRAQEASFQRMQRIAEETADDRAMLDAKFLATEGESIDFLNYVEALAEEKGIDLNTDRLDSAVDPQTRDTYLIVSFTYTGDYAVVTDFLAALENLPYLAEVTEFELRRSQIAGWQANTTLRVNVPDYEN